MHEQTDGRTARRDSLQTTCDCAYRRAAHGRRRRLLLLWSTPVISGAEWLICMREAPPAAPKHTGTACRLVVWLWLEARKQKLWWPSGKVWRAPGARRCRLTAVRRTLPPPAANSFRKWPHSFLHSRAEQSFPVLLASLYFLLFCSIIVRPVLGVTGSRGRWGPSQLSRGVWGELHPGQSPPHHIRFYFDPFCYIRFILFVCIIEL